MKGLFVNTEKANCSIYESGVMIYNCLKLSKKYDLNYVEINSGKNKFGEYDFYFFNYHPYTMRFISAEEIKKINGIKITSVLEVSPNDPFKMCPINNFDVYCAIDPTMKTLDKRVYAFSRPLDVFDGGVVEYKEKEIPLIGSFGFATPGKCFEDVIKAVNEEFDHAVVRINIPSATYADPATYKMFNMNYFDYIKKMCESTAKKGIQVIITNIFMKKKELIEWCGENTINCFLYNRNQPGLSATTDQAISSGRPLSVSANETFRHIHQYMKPYPYLSLKESIKCTLKSVEKMKTDWSPKNFVDKFEKILLEKGLF